MKDIIIKLALICIGALIGNLYNRTKSIPISWLEKYAETNQKTKFYADNDVYEAVSILGNACETVLANWYGEKYDKKRI